MNSNFQVNSFFITGATGLVGFSVIKKLRESDFNVIGLVRKSSNNDLIEELLQLDVKIVVGDLLIKETYENYLPTVDVVIHTAAIVKSNNVSDYFEVNCKGLEVLLRSMKQLGLTRLIHISTAGVYGVTGKHAVDESTPLRPLSDYTISKLKAEHIILDRYPEILTSIIRPPFIIGPTGLDRYVIPGLIELTNHRISIRVWRKNPSLGFVHVDDLVSLILLLSYKDTSESEIYNVQSFCIDYYTLVSMVRHVLEKRGISIIIPYFFLIFSSMLIDGLVRLFHRKSRRLYQKAKQVNSNWCFSTAKVKSEFDWMPTHIDPKEIELLVAEYLEFHS